jgi:hypothetical protein
MVASKACETMRYTPLGCTRTGPSSRVNAWATNCSAGFGGRRACGVPGAGTVGSGRCGRPAALSPAVAAAACTARRRGGPSSRRPGPPLEVDPGHRPLQDRDRRPATPGRARRDVEDRLDQARPPPPGRRGRSPPAPAPRGGRNRCHLLRRAPDGPARARRGRKDARPRHPPAGGRVRSLGVSRLEAHTVQALIRQHVRRGSRV